MSRVVGALDSPKHIRAKLSATKIPVLVFDANVEK